jgi:hypothetical protein
MIRIGIFCPWSDVVRREGGGRHEKSADQIPVILMCLTRYRLKRHIPIWRLLSTARSGALE